ncbi:hypothetical protein SAMN04488505_102226 [Chitinophaga rupis]|uniref:Uncharacterized protein n=1 Tax=Chitinophaga rupis TaxID=573321 RepID=A0A1H7Q2X8_9BACT|nr:hypothetical protein SAMN04488505_102226 [Chitinophaga rupis]
MLYVSSAPEHEQYNQHINDFFIITFVIFIFINKQATI